LSRVSIRSGLCSNRLHIAFQFTSGNLAIRALWPSQSFCSYPPQRSSSSRPLLSYRLNLSLPPLLFGLGVGFVRDASPRLFSLFEAARGSVRDWQKLPISSLPLRPVGWRTGRSGLVGFGFFPFFKYVTDREQRPWAPTRSGRFEVRGDSQGLMTNSPSPPPSPS